MTIDLSIDRGREEMANTYYGVYCKGILAVKTDYKNFCWVYGTAPLTADEDEYQKCVVKLDVTVIPEKKLKRTKSWDKKFQAYEWNHDEKEVFYWRKIFGFYIGYSICLKGNTICAKIGKNYCRLVKNRTMNLHGIYYLLSDIANIVLLTQGYLTLYASAVDDKSSCGTVLFAPPNTGKTVTATMLCKNFGYSLVGEDVVITDGNRIYGCPWTNSYRKKKNRFDSAGLFRRGQRPESLNMCDMCDITELVTLSLGTCEVSTRKEELLRQIKILNGYLFGYYNTPIVKILSYFDRIYDIPYGEIAEKMLQDMVEHCHCRCIQASNTMDFYRLIGTEVPDEEK